MVQEKKKKKQYKLKIGLLKLLQFFTKQMMKAQKDASKPKIF